MKNFLNFAKDVKLNLKWVESISCYNMNYYEIMSDSACEFGYYTGDKKMYILEEVEDDESVIRLHLCVENGEKHPTSLFSWCVDEEMGIQNA